MLDGFTEVGLPIAGLEPNKNKYRRSLSLFIRSIKYHMFKTNLMDLSNPYLNKTHLYELMHKLQFSSSQGKFIDRI